MSAATLNGAQAARILLMGLFIRTLTCSIKFANLPFSGPAHKGGKTAATGDKREHLTMRLKKGTPEQNTHLTTLHWPTGNQNKQTLGPISLPSEVPLHFVFDGSGFQFAFVFHFWVSSLAAGVEFQTNSSIKSEAIEAT